jgi:hypothetical protein
MESYYVTVGESGPLKATGRTTGPVVVGPTGFGEYIWLGEPPESYTKKTSEFDIWDTALRRWVKNSSEAALIAQRETEKVEGQWANVRRRRNKLLTDSDWTQLPDVPLATKEAWATYRQALRDVTEQPDPFNIVWPTPPG